MGKRDGPYKYFTNQKVNRLNGISILKYSHVHRIIATKAVLTDLAPINLNGKFHLFVF